MMKIAKAKIKFLDKKMMMMMNRFFLGKND